MVRSLGRSLAPAWARRHAAAQRRLARWCRPIGALVVAALAAGMAIAAGGETERPAGELPFSIPAQSLTDALQLYSKQAGVQVMFETASAEGYRSQPVEGAFPPDAALRILLGDTDLRIRYSRTDAITLAPASLPDPDQPPAHALAPADLMLDTLNVVPPGSSIDRGRLGEYIGVVQADIQKAIKKMGGGRRGDYRASVRLWIDASRTVQRAELEGLTGDHDRDRSIADALRGMTLSQKAPANTPQPIRFMISIHTL